MSTRSEGTVPGTGTSERPVGFVQAKREELPEEQRRALRSAIRWQIFTIGYTACTITLVAFVLGGSQAMKTAWIEDMLSLLPQLAFLVALIFVRRPPTPSHPYGWHRAMGIGHLVAGLALLAVGSHLAFEAATGLIGGERPEVENVEIFGQTVWLGWIMCAVMLVIVIGPLFYGRAKAKLAPILHNKVLYADADMAKADWQTNVASIVGVLGIGAGIWWLDGVAALFISVGIIWDGLRNAGAAVSDLMDQRARTFDGSSPHPLRDEILARANQADWVEEAAVRIRDQGQVLHVELFVRPKGEAVEMRRLGELGTGVAVLDWKIHDVVVVPCDPLPEYADRLEAQEVIALQ